VRHGIFDARLGFLDYVSDAFTELFEGVLRVGRKGLVAVGEGANDVFEVLECGERFMRCRCSLLGRRGCLTGGLHLCYRFSRQFRGLGGLCRCVSGMKGNHGDVDG